MKVVLIGYMASGKSTVGKLLAKYFGFEFVDLDNYIEQQLQKTIPEIFSEKGEVFFRKMEGEMLQRVLAENESIVLSTGGGTPCYGSNMDIILNNADHSFYLQLSVPALVERIKNEKDTRPLVKDLSDEELPEFIGKHLFERRQFYSKANHSIDCDKKSVEEVIEAIKNELL